MFGRHTNKAGIDLAPAVAKRLGIDSHDAIDWWFADAVAVPGTLSDIDTIVVVSAVKRTALQDAAAKLRAAAEKLQAEAP